MTFGARLVGDAPSVAFASQLAWNAWILGAFVLVFRIASGIESKGTGPIVAWGIALSVLTLLGIASEHLLA